MTHRATAAATSARAFRYDPCPICGNPKRRVSLRCWDCRVTDAPARFWAKVQKTDGCWLWMGKRTAAGYGKNVRMGGRQFFAHRLAWVLTHGSIPDGMWVLHRCDNPPCVRPDHLFLGDSQDNVDDMRAKGRGPDLRGEKSAGAVLTEAAVREIRRRNAAGDSHAAIARDMGVHKTTVASVVQGRTWRHVQ